MKAVDSAIYRAKKKHGYILFVEEEGRYVICRLPSVRELEAAVSTAIFRDEDKYFIASLLYEDLLVESNDDSDELRYDMEEKIADILPVSSEKYKTFENDVLNRSHSEVYNLALKVSIFTGDGFDELLDKEIDALVVKNAVIDEMTEEKSQTTAPAKADRFTPTTVVPKNPEKSPTYHKEFNPFGFPNITITED